MSMFALTGLGRRLSCLRPPTRAVPAHRNSIFKDTLKLSRKLSSSGSTTAASATKTRAASGNSVTPGAKPAAITSTPSSNSATATTTPLPLSTVADKTPTGIQSLPLWQRLGPITAFLKFYARVQRDRPYATQCASSMTVYFFGDLLAQYVGGVEKWDPRRTGRNVIIGGLFSFPGYHWFLWLGNSFNYSSKMLSIATKVVVNQLVFTPAFSSYFFGMQALLTGVRGTEIWERIRTTVPVSFMKSLQLWPAVTVINFTYVPPQYRFIFAGSVAVVWQSYLSWLNRKAEVTEVFGKDRSEPVANPV